MTTRPTLDTTPEDASLAQWAKDMEGFVEGLIGSERLPSAPAEIKVTSQSNSVKVTFRAVNEVGVSEYNIYRSTDKNFAGGNAELIATVTQAIDPSGVDIFYIDPGATEKNFYFVSAVKGLRRPRLEGPVVGFGSSVAGKAIGEGVSGGVISGFSGTPGSILFVNEDSLVDQDNDNFFYSQSFKAMVVGGAGLAWGPHNSPDVFLVRDGSDILAMRRGINAQAFRIYENTVTVSATPITATVLTSGSSETDGTAYNTSSVSPGSDKLILAVVHGLRLSVAANPVPTAAGNGLTWVQVLTKGFEHGGGETDRTRVTVFRAMGSSPSSGAITFTFAEINARASWSVIELDNIDTGGVNGADAIIQAVASAEASITNPVVNLAAFGSVENATLGITAWSDGNATVTEGAGFTELSEDRLGSAGTGTQTQFRNDNDTTVDSVLTSSIRNIIIGIEIKNAAQPGGTRYLEFAGLGASGGAEVMTVTGSGVTDRDLIVGTRGASSLRFYANNIESVRLNPSALGVSSFLHSHAFTSDGSGTEAALHKLSGTLTGANEDTVSLFGHDIDPTIVTQTATEDIADIASLNIEEPKITDNLTGDIVVASTLRIGGAPDEGLTNWSLNVVSGNSFLGGDLDVNGDAELLEADIGNDVPGRTMRIGRNTNVAIGTVGPAPSIWEMEQADGTSKFFWVDDEGDLRIHTAPATGNTGAPTVDANEDGFKIQVHESVHFSFRSKPGSSGVNYLGGFYNAPVADANIDEGTPTKVLGTANHPYAAHAFVVHAGAGAAAGGSGVVEVEVSGTSITDAGVRQVGDTEVIIADITAMSTHTYAETTLKWIGQVTYTIQLIGGATHTTFNADFNYGFTKYNDIGNRDFQLQQFDAVGRAGASDAGFNLEVLHHKATGWTYHASAFVPGTAPIADLVTLYSTESDLNSGEDFAFKRVGLSTEIKGNNSEGFLVRVTTTGNNSVEFLDFGITVALN